MRIYPFAFIVDFADWYERKYGRNDVLLALVGSVVLFAWTLLYMALRALR